MASVLDRAIAHFQASEGTIVEVPEWGEAPDRPLRVHVRPVTIGERRLIMKSTEDKTGFDATLKTIIRACTDADTGEPLFRDSHLPQLRKSVHPAVLNRLARAIDDLDGTGEDGAADPVDEAEGN